MVLSDKYETCGLVAGGEVPTYNGRKLSSGERVWIHLFEGGPTEANRAVLDGLTRLPAPEARLFLDAGEDGKVLYLVSSLLPGFTDLRQWVESALSPPPKPPEAVPSEFTRYFQGSAAPAAAPARAPEKPPGEFTRFFGSAPVETAEAQTEPPGPSEYTLLLASQPAPPPPAPPAAPPKPAPAAKRSSLPLIVCLAALVTAAALLVLYFVFRS